MGIGGLEGSAVTAIGSAGVAFIVSMATYSWKARGLFADLDKKISSMELETERNFVRRSDFQNALDSFTRSIDNLRADNKAERAELKEEYASLRALLTEFIFKANLPPR